MFHFLKNQISIISVRYHPVKRNIEQVNKTSFQICSWTYQCLFRNMKLLVIFFLFLTECGARTFLKIAVAFVLAVDNFPAI